MVWLVPIIEFIVGCAILVWSADRFISASASIAKRFGMPAFLAGMLFVGFGTSFPEMVVSAMASIGNTPNLAIGNVLGSNVMNIGLVIGLTALITPLKVHSDLLKHEFPILIIITLIVGAMFWVGTLTRVDGCILLAILVLYLYWMFYLLPKSEAKDDILVQEFSEEPHVKGMPFRAAVIWWIICLILIFISSELMVTAAVTIAKILHVSDLLIGLTIVAIGTSLPELAASIISALRNEPDIAVGNIVGSNVFNLLAVLAMPALIMPGKLPAQAFSRDYLLMLGFTLALWIFSYCPPHKKQIGRVAGVLLLLGFFGYMGLLIGTA